MAGMIGLGVYAVLLGVGGLIGFLKAGSRPSLIAGSISALVALGALAWRYSGGPGFVLGLVLAALMAGMFSIRFRKSGKFMPSGLLAATSVVMVVILGLALTR